MAEKATFKDLLAKKVQRDKKREMTKNIYVSSMGKELTFKLLDERKAFDILDEMQDEGLGTTVDAFGKLIYLSCPMLQDPQLHEELGIADPFDTVEALFDVSDILEIGEHLTEMFGIGKTAEKIKNS